MSADGEKGGTYPQSKAFRDSLSHQQQMFDAQHQCVPCKLCGGHAVISDAGAGNGYYINCSNYSSFQSSRGCMIDQQRLGGWAYNVMGWWNRLHTAAPATDTPAVVSDAVLMIIRNVLYRSKMNGCSADVYDTAEEIAAALAKHPTSPEDAA